MKNQTLTVLCCALLCAACSKDYDPVPVPSKDSSLEGPKQDMTWLGKGPRKLFVLNEGGMGSNNASLDFLRFSDGAYVTGAFRKMNPGISGGLGDVGNDIAVRGDELWIVVNNSGIVEVVSAEDETEIAAVQVPTPRSIAFDDKYAYVTSWAGAFASGSYDDKGNYTIVDSSNPKGRVYRIGLGSKKVEGSVEVGYQPEGIACSGGKLYVANSGGISSQLPPAYSYDNTVSIIDAATFTLSRSVEVAVNLKSVWADGKGAVYVTSMGNFWDVPTGLYMFPEQDPSKVGRVGSDAVKPEALHVSCSCIHDGTVYCLGTENEYEWGVSHKYYVWSFTPEDRATGKGRCTFYPQEFSGTPYGICVLDGGADTRTLLVGDAGDYFNPGTVSCYPLDFNAGEKSWTVGAGVCPGHFAIW